MIYTPNASYSGADPFTFKVNDGALDSNVATVTVLINAVNVAPVAQGQTISTDEDKAVEYRFKRNGQQWRCAELFDHESAQLHGKISGTGTNLTYTPNADYNGSDNFIFKANDGKIDSNLTMVNLTIKAIKTVLPQSVFSMDFASGIAPLTVKFDGSASEIWMEQLHPTSRNR